MISTVHSAKGLEWDIVHVLHAADGNFPSDMALVVPGRPGGGAAPLLRRAHPSPTAALHVYVPLRYHHRPRGRDDVHNLAQLSRFLTPDVQALFDIVHAGRTVPVDDVVSKAASASLVDSALQALLR